MKTISDERNSRFLKLKEEVKLIIEELYFIFNSRDGRALLDSYKAYANDLVVNRAYHLNTFRSGTAKEITSNARPVHRLLESMLNELSKPSVGATGDKIIAEVSEFNEAVLSTAPKVDDQIERLRQTIEFMRPAIEEIMTFVRDLTVNGFDDTGEYHRAGSDCLKLAILEHPRPISFSYIIDNLYSLLLVAFGENDKKASKELERQMNEAFAKLDWRGVDMSQLLPDFNALDGIKLDFIVPRIGQMNKPAEFYIISRDRHTTFLRNAVTRIFTPGLMVNGKIHAQAQVGLSS